MPRDEELREADGCYDRAAVVVAMGLRPCSGAVLVLLFAKVIGVYAWGILSALMMAAGTALRLLALLVFFSRRVAERLITPRASSRWRNVVWSTLAFAVGRRRHDNAGDIAAEAAGQQIPYRPVHRR